MYYVFFTKIPQGDDTVFFTKGVLEFAVKVLDKCTDRVSKNSFRQVATNSFNFPEEILKRNNSLFLVLAVCKEVK